MALRRRPLRLLILLAVVAGLGVASAAGITLRHRQQLRRTAERLQEQARSNFALGKFREAATHWEQYLALKPDDNAARLGLAQSLDRVAVARKARTNVFLLYDETLRNDPTLQDVRRRIIEIALELDRIPDARSHLVAYEQSNERDGWYWEQTARVHRALGEDTAAVTSARSAIQLDPSRLMAAQLLIDLLGHRMGQIHEADAVASQIVAANPKSIEARLLRVRHLTETHRTMDAEPDIREAIELAPDDQRTMTVAIQWSIAALLTPPTSSAPQREPLLAFGRRIAERAITSHPSTSDFPMLASQLEQAAGTPERSVRILESALERLPNDVRLLARLAELAIQANQPDRARELTERIPNSAITQPLKLCLDGSRALQNDQVSLACATLEQALRAAADLPLLTEYIALQIAECHRRGGQSDLEAAAYRRALRANPQSEPARLGLAEYAARNQHWDDVIAECRALPKRSNSQVLLTRALIEKNRQLPPEVREETELRQLIAALNQSQRRKLIEFVGAEAVESHERTAPPVNPPATAANDPDIELPTDELQQEIEELIRLSDRRVFVDHWKTRLGAFPKAARQTWTARAAMELQRRGHIADAGDLVEWLEKNAPDDIATLHLSIRQKALVGQSREAVALLESAAASSQSTPQRQALLAALAWELAEATKDDGSSAELSAQLASSGDTLARGLLQDRPEALVLLAAFLSLDVAGRDPTGHSLLTWDDLLVHQRHDPLFAVERAQKLSPSRIQRLETAAGLALRNNPSFVALAVSLADFEALLGRYEIAERWYRHALTLSPNDATILNNLAWLLALQSRSLQEAKQLIDRAIRIAGDEPRLLDTRGCVALASGQAAIALRDFESSLAIQPGPVTAIHLAQARLALKNRRGAEEALRILQREGITRERLHPLERRQFDLLTQQLQ